METGQERSQWYTVGRTTTLSRVQKKISFLKTFRSQKARKAATKEKLCKTQVPLSLGKGIFYAIL
jgi:hypothetical protein